MKNRKPRRWIERLPVRSLGVLLPPHDFTFDPEAYKKEWTEKHFGLIRAPKLGPNEYTTYARIEAT